MNEVWNLNPIYKGFEDPAFDADLTRLSAAVQELGELAENLEKTDPLEGLKAGIAKEEEILSLVNKLAEYASLRQAADARDPEAGSNLGRIMAVYSGTAAPEAAFRAWAAAIPNLMELVAGEPVLKEYTYLFSNIRKDSRYLMNSKAEEVAARMGLSGGNAWAELQGYLTSTVPVSYEGKTTNLSAIRNMAYDADPAVRKSAYEAELACYDRIADSVAFALNSLKLETISDCQLRGYGSPLERTLLQAHMEQKTLEAMFAAMDEALPSFWKYLKVKGKALGHEKGLPWYDLFAPMGKASTHFTTEQARDFLIDQFRDFNPEEAQMIEEAFRNEWIDFFPRDGKAGGAFCAGVECLGESRILTNFDGAFTDVVTLAHELGHAYHNHCIRSHRPLNHDYSMPVAETASTFNECVVMASAIGKAANREEKLNLIESQLQDATQIICDIYSRFCFEDRVFKNRSEKFMDAPELCAMMLEAQKKCYGDGLDPDTLHPYMWVCKGHYYGSTYYNFPYAFGGLFARGLYAQYEKEGAAFIPKYKKLLYATTVCSAEDTAKVAGIDLTDQSFWAGALKIITDEIELFCQLAEA